ncbi:thioesterase II family protein [Kitasatospora sp. P5_F3]
MSVTSVESGAWTRRFHPAPEAPTRLVCFPHAGGSATYYFPVSRALSPGLDVVSIQYPGRQDRRHEPGVDSVDRLADLVVEELGDWLDRPLALFGHSLGATLAFEVAKRLERRGVVPVALFASGRRAPSRHRPGRVHLYGDAELIANLKKMSGTDAQVLGDDEMLQMIMPAIRSDYKAAETYQYRPGPKLSCPIIALTGDEDPEVNLEEARAWSEHTTAGFEMQVFQGGHFYLNQHAPAVLRAITTQLGG